jgi:hypothetical protein
MVRGMADQRLVPVASRSAGARQRPAVRERHLAGIVGRMSRAGVDRGLRRRRTARRRLAVGRSATDPVHGPVAEGERAGVTGGLGATGSDCFGRRTPLWGAVAPGKGRCGNQHETREKSHHRHVHLRSPVESVSGTVPAARNRAWRRRIARGCAARVPLCSAKYRLPEGVGFRKSARAPVHATVHAASGLAMPPGFAARVPPCTLLDESRGFAAQI